MFNLNISPNMTMGWLPVDNKMYTKTINGYWLFDRNSKPVKKIKKRTHRLNYELKKFAGLKSYSQYVKTKTVILRDISDNENTEDEMYNSDKEYDVFSQSQCTRVQDCAMFLSIEQTNPKNKIKKKKHKNASNVSRTSFDNPETSNVQKTSPNKKANPSNVSRTSFDNPEKSNVRKISRNKKESCHGGTDSGGYNNEDIDIASDHQQHRVHKTRTNARRNLTALLDNFHENIADPIIDVAQNMQMIENYWDYANNSSSSSSSSSHNNNNNNDNDDNDDDDNDDKKVRDMNNRESFSSYAETSCPQPGDLGIPDDDSQNNLSVDKQTKDIMVFDDDDDDDKPTVTHAISKSNNEKEMNDEEEEEKLSVIADETQKQKSQPTITSTAIVKSKYTIIRDENEKDETQLLLVDRSEIVTQDEESTKLDGASPESRRLGQLKRINLMSSDSSSSSDTESDSIQSNDETMDSKGTYLQSFRIISELSDSDESIGSIASAERSQDIVHNDQSLQTSNDDDGIRRNNVATGMEKRTIKCQIEEQESISNAESMEKFQNDPTPPNTSSTKKKKILGTKSDDSPIKKKRRLIGDGRATNTATSADSLGYVLHNLCTGSINEDPLLDNTNNNNNDGNINETEYDGELDETTCRPIELMDFITRQGLIATSKLSTITIDDVTIDGKKDEDDEIWLLEIPKMIARDHQLCGQSLSLERTNMRIGQAKYDIIRRYEKSISVILPIQNKEEAQYTIANISPIGSIQLTRCEPTNEVISILERQNRGQEEAEDDEQQLVDRGNVAPPRFPKNVKSRNPLKSMVGENGNSNGNDNNSNCKKNRKSMNHHRVWHIGNFISKSKKNSSDIPTMLSQSK